MTCTASVRPLEAFHTPRLARKFVVKAWHCSSCGRIVAEDEVICQNPKCGAEFV